MKWILAACLLACLSNTSVSGHASPEEVTASQPQRLKVVSWNVLYGFNHGRAVDEGAQWIRGQKPDVLALQELNGFTNESFQAAAQSFGHPYAVLQKEQGFAMGLSATAPIEVIERRVEGFHHGYLHGKTHGIDFFVVHFWPGKEHEAETVLAKARALASAGARVVILGDFNSHSEKDASYLASKPLEPRFEVIKSVEEADFVDLVHRFDRNAPFSCPSPITIPKWSKDLAEVESKRQRIDFILADAQLAQHSRAATIARSEALDAISDHYPVIAEFAQPPLPGASDPSAFAFAVIADCQYCAAPPAGVRHYAESRWKLEACVDHLQSLDLAYAVHLGDFIDRDFESFDVVAPIYDSLACDSYHVLGNHDYSVTDEHKATVPRRLGMPASYYDFEVDDWRFIVLDGNDISLHAHVKGTPAHTAAEEYHREHAPKAPTWNGALGPDQLAWLQSTLDEACKAQQRVVLYCHFPVFPANAHNLWNAEDVLKLIDEHPCVKAYVNGHNHAGNYAVRSGVHYLTLKGMVDTQQTSYAVVEVHQDALSILGYGRELDRILKLR